MMKRLGHIGGVLAVVLMLVAGLTRWEWPMPQTLQNWLKKELAAQMLELDYKDARWDILGHVRLSGVSGRYRGLVSFAAKQVLLRWRPAGKLVMTVDAGRLHTGLLQLPVPETIDFGGTVEKKGGAWSLSNWRMRAGSLIVLASGRYEPTPGAKESPAASPETMKALAGLMAGLCNDKELWVGQVELKGTDILTTWTGKKIAWQEYLLQEPVIHASWPNKEISLTAEALTTPWAKANGLRARYESGRWEGWIGQVAHDETRLGPVVLGARWPIDELANLAAAKDLWAWGKLSREAGITARVAQLKPLRAELSGKLPGLDMVGIKLETKKPAVVWGTWAGDEMSFAARAGTGSFYGLDFAQLRAQGVVSAQRVWLDAIEMKGPGGWARGSLGFVFDSRKASYRLTGQIDPLSLPWFGPEWAKAFEPMTPLRATTAVALELERGEVQSAIGITASGAHRYGRQKLESTVAGFAFDNKRSQVNFYTRAEGGQWAKGQLNIKPVVVATLRGELLPTTLAKAYLDETPEVLENLFFDKPPAISATLSPAGYTVVADAPGQVRFYGLDFESMRATVTQRQGELRIEPVEFGFAGGTGGLTAQLDEEGNGYGSAWVRQANLGEWSLLGPLSEMLKSKLLSFATLKFNSLDASFTLEPERITIDPLNLWGNEHAAQAKGSIDTKEKTVDMTVHLKTLAGSKPTLGGVFAPILQPFASIVEARMSGPVEKPVWKVQLASPF